MLPNGNSIFFNLFLFDLSISTRCFSTLFKLSRTYQFLIMSLFSFNPTLCCHTKYGQRLLHSLIFSIFSLFFPLKGFYLNSDCVFLISNRASLFFFLFLFSILNFCLTRCFQTPKYFQTNFKRAKRKSIRK